MVILITVTAPCTVSATCRRSHIAPFPGCTWPQASRRTWGTAVSCACFLVWQRKKRGGGALVVGGSWGTELGNGVNLCFCWGIFQTRNICHRCEGKEGCHTYRVYATTTRSHKRKIRSHGDRGRNVPLLSPVFDSPTPGGERGWPPNQSIMVSINSFLDCTRTVHSTSTAHKQGCVFMRGA